MSTALAIVDALLEDDDAKDFALSSLPDYDPDEFGYVDGYVSLYGQIPPGEDEHEAASRVLTLLLSKYGRGHFGVFEIFQAMEEAGLGTVEQMEAEYFAESAEDVDIEGTIARATTPRWKVEWLIGFGNWDDAGWTQDEKPLRFKSKAEAERAIDEFIADVGEAVDRGDMSDRYERRHFRAVPADPLER